MTEFRAEVQRETDLRERLEAELKEGKQANAQLLEMNEELSTRVSDNLHAIKALQDREAGLQQRLEAVKAQLESAQQVIMGWSVVKKWITKIRIPVLQL